MYFHIYDCATVISPIEDIPRASTPFHPQMAPIWNALGPKHHERFWILPHSGGMYPSYFSSTRPHRQVFIIHEGGIRRGNVEMGDQWDEYSG